MEYQGSSMKSLNPPASHTSSTYSETTKSRRLRKILTCLTPKCKMLYRRYKRSRKQPSFICRAQNAMQFSKRNSFEKMVAKMKPPVRGIMFMQIKTYLKNKKANKFSLKEKLFALYILKQGAECYPFLQKVFILPSVLSLKKMVSPLRVYSGINIEIFNAIKEECKNWTEDIKYCNILFNETLLQPSLNYTYRDEMCGFVELPEKINQFADRALVFMATGVVRKWQLPIAFYCYERTISSNQIKQMLHEVISAVGDTGLRPLALVTDERTSFQSALKSYQEETRKVQIRENKTLDDTILIGGFNLSIIFDPLHLMKGLRNNFLTKNISFAGKIASWEDIVYVYQRVSECGGNRLLYKLHDERIIPDKVNKMKVKNYACVFSKALAGVLCFSSKFPQDITGRPISKTLKNTSEIVSFFDDLFDSVNGTFVFNKKRRTRKELRSAVTNNSKHHLFWQNAIRKLLELKFVDHSGKESRVLTIRNWITTLKSMERIWQFLKNNNIEIMRPRFLNSDAMENFFEDVQIFTRDTPTCQNFVSVFKMLLFAEFIKLHRISFNCEDDTSWQLLGRWMELLLFKFKTKPFESLDRQHKIYEASINTYSVSQDARHDHLIIQSRAYATAWVVRKILSHIHCRNCKKDLIVKEDSGVHGWISQREYKYIARKNLVYPAEAVVLYFKMIFEETMRYLEENAHVKTLSQNIRKEIENKNDFSKISCPLHRDEVIYYLLTISIKLGIHNWCTILNRILQGKDSFRLKQAPNLHLSEMQKKAVIKYRKKFKIKVS